MSYSRKLKEKEAILRIFNIMIINAIFGLQARMYAEKIEGILAEVKKRYC